MTEALRMQASWYRGIRTGMIALVLAELVGVAASIAWEWWTR